MLDYWVKVFNKTNEQITGNIETITTSHTLEPLWNPITLQEIEIARKSIKSAPGVDGISAKAWSKININTKRLLYNMFLFFEDLPETLKKSRTIFLPKVQNGSSDPKDFRPISIGSVVTREFNRILSNRLSVHHNFDNRQSAYLRVDGVAQNVMTLSALIEDSKDKLNELHIVSKALVHFRGNIP